MCLVPDGDLFDAIGDGRASVVTDRIETLTETGLALASGSELEADLIVTATGLKMVPFGGIRLSVDGSDVELGAALVYRGMQVSGVPNMAFAFGYTNQSWTLGADLTCEQVCQLLEHMDRCGYTACTPRNRDPAITGVPFADLTSGYVLRAIDQFPRQGSKDPWRREQNYARNRRSMRRAPNRRSRARVLAGRSDNRRDDGDRRLRHPPRSAGQRLAREAVASSASSECCFARRSQTTAAPPERVSDSLTNEGGAVMPRGYGLSEATKDADLGAASGGAERSRDRAPARPCPGDGEQPPGESGRHPAQGPPAPRALPELRRARGDLARDRPRSLGPRHRPRPGSLPHDDRP